MAEEKVDIQELARKVDELLNLLNVIAGDLAEVSKSLKKVNAPSTAAPAPTSAPFSAVPSEKRRGIDDVKQAFSSELAGMLFFEESGSFVIVKPRRFLGSDNFAKIASVIREIGGEYVSSGRNSHFKVPK